MEGLCAKGRDKAKVMTPPANQKLPPGVKIVPFYDQSFVIDGTIRTVEKNLFEGFVLVTVLLLALKEPYAGARGASCAELAAKIRELDAVLGTDLDSPPADSDPGLVERGTAAAKDTAIRQLRGAAEGVVPYRGWVRKLSGAERYSRDVNAAVTAGTIRRGYLKGLGEAAGCPAPAAPPRAER